MVVWAKPVSGNHKDLYQIEPQLASMMNQLRESGISAEGLFLNADAGFDAKIVRKTLEKEGVILNVAPNKRNGEKLDSEDFFDELMYQERFVVEGTNAWMDSFRTLLIRQDTSISSWWAWHFIASTCWMVKLLGKQKKNFK